MDSIDNYTDFKRLGDGSFGTVYSARRLPTNKLYALKKISFIDSRMCEKQASLNQIRLLASIEHEHIVSYKSTFFDETEQCLYLVMEYAQNGDLSAQIQHRRTSPPNTPFPQPQIWKLLHHISKALKCLHQNRILHRDLKPANIVLSNGKYKLADMNISRRVKPGELIKTTIGTPYYLSPEVWRRTEYDWKVDIWSLGVIAYEMAMLELPFPAETRGELERRVLGGRFREIGNQYSGELRGLICEMMRKEPDGRPCPSEVISRCIYGSYKSGVGSAEKGEIIDNPLLNPIEWPEDIAVLPDLLPKPQYDDQVTTTTPNNPRPNLQPQQPLQQPQPQPQTPLRPQSSFRLRTNSKNENSKIENRSRRNSYKVTEQKGIEQPFERLRNLNPNQVVLNNSNSNSVKQNNSLKPPILRKIYSKNEEVA